jgi:hypothetical protein
MGGPQNEHNQGGRKSIMILTTRYPHVRSLVEHYAYKFSDQQALSILERGLNSESDAEHFSHFIWKMIDEMAKDRKEGNLVLGGSDNTSMLPDVSYEMDTLMEESGYSRIWEEISDKV